MQWSPTSSHGFKEQSNGIQMGMGYFFKQGQQKRLLWKIPVKEDLNEVNGWTVLKSNGKCSGESNSEHKILREKWGAFIQEQ